MIQNLIDKISARLTEEYVGTGKVLCLNDVFGCLSGDVIFNLAFARSHNLIDTQHWESPFTLAVNSLVTTSHWMGHFSWIVPIMNCIPDQVLMALSSKLRPLVAYRQVRVWINGRAHSNDKLLGIKIPNQGYLERSQNPANQISLG